MSTKRELRDLIEAHLIIAAVLIYLAGYRTGMWLFWPPKPPSASVQGAVTMSTTSPATFQGKTVSISDYDFKRSGCTGFCPREPHLHLTNTGLMLSAPGAVR